MAIMTAEKLIELIEELVDLKVQKYVEMNLKLPPEVARLLQAKRETDHRRLEQIRIELVRALAT
jgi:DNA repair photolyase